MGRKGVETLVGVFVLLGMLGLLFLALKAANLSGFGGGDTYSLTAYFDNIGGLKVRAPVRSAGVTVGRVASITLDSKRYQGAVKLEIDRSERLFARLQQWLDRVRGKARTVVLHLVLQSALETDAVVEQIIALRFVGEVAAAHQFAARRGPPLLDEELLEVGVLVRVIDVAGKGGAVVIRTAGGVGDEILAPGVEDLAPGVGEAVGDEDVELAGAGLVAKDARVGTAFGAPGRFDL